MILYEFGSEQLDSDFLNRCENALATYMKCIIIKNDHPLNNQPPSCKKAVGMRVPAGGTILIFEEG